MHQWIDINGVQIEGCDQSEFVTVLDDDILSVALSHDTKDRLPPTELGEMLCTQLELPRNRRTLLQTIVGNDVRKGAQHKQTVDALERGGISVPDHIQDYRNFHRNNFFSPSNTTVTSEGHLSQASRSNFEPAREQAKERMPSICVSKKDLQVRISDIRAAAKRFVQGDVQIVLQPTNAVSISINKQDDEESDIDNNEFIECVETHREDDESRDGSESSEEGSDEATKAYHSLLDDDSGISEEPGTLEGLEDDVSNFTFDESLSHSPYKKRIGNAGENIVSLTAGVWSAVEK